jgi:hypothetical protein
VPVLDLEDSDGQGDIGEKSLLCGVYRHEDRMRGKIGDETRFKGEGATRLHAVALPQALSDNGRERGHLDVPLGAERLLEALQQLRHVSIGTRV